MKTVGFLEKHEKKVLGNIIDFNEAHNNSVSIGKEVLKDILKYLSGGMYIYGMPLELEDKGKLIGPYIVYSDGEWIWPGYYSHYIASGEIKTIPLEFFERIKAYNFNVPQITAAKEKDAKNYFMELLLQNNPKYRKR